MVATITEPDGHTPRELAYNPHNGYMYVADVTINTISVIDTKTNKLLASIPVGGGIDGLAYDSLNGDIYAVDANGIVYVVDGSTNKVIDTIKVGSNSLEAEFNPDNGYIYVVNQWSSSVSVIDGSTNKVIDTITGIPDPVQLDTIQIITLCT